VVSGRRRPPISRETLLRALIYRNLRGISTLVDLEYELNNNPSMLYALGLDPFKKSPSDERFSAFLRSTPNWMLQSVRRALVKKLIEEKVISTKTVAFDSCAIEATVKENNLKTSVKNRYDKKQKPRGDRQARLGVSIHFLQPFKKQVHYFWGYRNHIINDTQSELPIVERTYPANKSEKKVAVPLLKQLRHDHSLAIKTVIGDANYDTETILDHIINNMKAEAVIPRNPGNTQNTPYTIRKGQVYCQAELAMYRKGKMRSKGITYCQYSCPLYWSQQYQGKYLLCPAGHPKYFNQKGCNVLLRLSPSVRQKINYGTKQFRSIYKTRTSVERIFSRLLAISMQDPTVKGLHSISNHCTIAHITVLLVALTAHKTGHQDKIRFVKSFVPNFLTS